MFPCTAGGFLSEEEGNLFQGRYKSAWGKEGKKFSSLLLGFNKLRTHSLKRLFSFSPAKTRTLQGVGIVGFSATSACKNISTGLYLGFFLIMQS